MKASSHFGIKCPCGELAAVPLPASLVDEQPVRILRRLPEKDRRDLVAFWGAHEDHGELVPCVVDIQPEEKA